MTPSDKVRNVNDMPHDVNGNGTNQNNNRKVNSIAQHENEQETENGNGILPPNKSTSHHHPPKTRRTIPSGFRLGGGAKELHGHAIYCVAWSSDLLLLHNDSRDNVHQDTTATLSNPSACANESDGGSTSTNTTTVNGEYHSPTPSLLRCLATCGGNYVTIYEVDALGSNSDGHGHLNNNSYSMNGMNGNHESSSSLTDGGLRARQAYRDADDEETFYTCAFGGRSIGSQFGYHPRNKDSNNANSGADADVSSAVVIDANQQTGSTSDSSSDSPYSSNGASTHHRHKHYHYQSRRKRKREPSQTNNHPTNIYNNTTNNNHNDNHNNNNNTNDENLFQTLSNLSKYDGPQLLCVAGRRGIIKVIDTVRRSLLLTLSGHGDEIYDMAFSPTVHHGDKGRWLLLSASKDESLRLWNVHNATCVAIFAGHEGHRDSVLSVAWHPLGHSFASSGMDTTVKLWSIDSPEMKRAIDHSYTVQKKRKNLTTTVNAHNDHGNTNVNRNENVHENDSGHITQFTTLYEQLPIFSSNKMHTDYVDCVQFVGDLILSKSISGTIALWKPDLSSSAVPPERKNGSMTNNAANSNSHNNNNNNNNNKTSSTSSSPPSTPSNNRRLRNKVIPLRDFTLSHCNIWFVRFQTDCDCRMLAIGNTKGDIKVWDIAGGSNYNPFRKPLCNLVNGQCASTVRMVSFSPDGTCLVATCDDGTLWKWDAIL